MRTAMESFEYAIKKDVRNNPIVREVDQAREREQWKWIGIAACLVAVLLFAAWQRWEVRQHGYDIADLQRELSREQHEGQKLLLKMEELRSPKRIDDLARRQLGMIQPELGDSIVIERVQPADPPASSVIAERR
jgi:cell division protein FtsL